MLAVAAAWVFAATGEEFTATVTSVPSGYIFVMQHDGQKERGVLAGVRCPWTTTPEGKEGKVFSSERVLNKEVQARVVRREEKLCYVKVQLPTGEDLAELLLAEGLACWDGRYDMDVTRYRDLEEQAREKRLGVWANYTPSIDITASPTEAVQGSNEAPARPSGAHLPPPLLLKDGRSKDYGLQASVDQAVLASRKQKRKARDQQLIDREQQITQRGHQRPQQHTNWGGGGYGGSGGYYGGYGGSYGGYGYDAVPRASQYRRGYRGR